jgi:hypothetical protein
VGITARLSPGVPWLGKPLAVTLAAVVLGLCAPTAPILHAAVFHVAQRHPGAADANPGTAELPWLTFGRAAVAARGGDTVFVHEGVYRDEVSLNASGEPGRPITFKGEEGLTTLTGTDPIAGWSRHTGSIYRAQLTWWAEEGWLKCRDKAGNWNGVGGHDTDDVFVDGVPLEEVTGLPEKPGQFSFDHGTTTVSVWLADSADPDTKTVEAARRGHCLWIRGSHIRVEGFTMRGAALNIIQIRGGDHNAIVGNHLSHGGVGGVHVTKGADRALIKDNVLAFFGYCGVQISRNSNHTTIVGNDVGHVYGDALVVQNGSPGGVGHRFVDNTIHDVISEDGIDIKCGRDYLVKGNVIYACSNVGIQVFNHHGSKEIRFEHYRNNKALIEGNVIFANGGGGIVVYEGEYVIRNNVIYDNGHEEPYGDHWGGRMHRKPGGFAIEVGPCFKIDGRTPRQEIVNNTCYQNARGEIWIGGRWDADPLHCLVRKNILAGGPGGILLKVNRVGIAQLDSDHNALWIGEGGGVAEWDSLRDKETSPEASSRETHVGTPFASFDAYRDATGMDAHSLWTRPTFNNARKGDFSLRPDSRCLKPGIGARVLSRTKLPVPRN